MNVFWSNVVCKAEKNKIVRKDLLSNFYLISKNCDFYLYDLKKDMKKPKNKLEIGSKRGLNIKSSQMTISDCIFYDFSNLIVFSNNKTNSVEVKKLWYFIYLS
jgi:hypothetical protein